MLCLTEGIKLTVDATSGQVAPGWHQGVSWQAVPVRLWVTLEGRTGEATGFLVNVAEIKKALHRHLEQEELTVQGPEDVLGWARRIIRDSFEGLRLIRVKLDMSENLSIAGGPEDDAMVEVTKKYELAAAHKLWNDDWDMQRNLEVFGKCSNPRGHGHNYTLEVTIRGKPDSRSGQIVHPKEIDDIVGRVIVDKFDHKNLNEDVEEFAGLMPTVENMAQVFFELLEGQFESVQLARVAVWETPSTYAEYFGPAAGPLRFSDSV